MTRISRSAGSISSSRCWSLPARTWSLTIRAEYYGERRIAALGLADGIPLSVVFTDRLTPTGAVVRRLISARLSNRKERRRYAESLEAIRLEDDRA